MFSKVLPARVKAGEDYEKIKSQIKPLDLIVFKGDGLVSDTILYLSGRALGPEAAQYSHCGFIITKDILDIPELIPGKLYIFESTMSGQLGGGVYNVQGHTFLGCQIRDFDAVIKSYDSAADTQVNWCQLRDNPWAHALESGNSDYTGFLKNAMYNFYKSHNGRRYTINIYQLFAAMFPPLRQWRPNLFEYEFVFCSELAAMMYNAFNVLKCDPANVVPADFLVKNQEISSDLFTKNLITVRPEKN